MNENDPHAAHASGMPICFGLDRATDELSLAAFLRLASSEQVLATLIPRLSDGEITATVDFFTRLFRTHLTKKEYHELLAGGQF